MPEFINETACIDCGVALYRHWNTRGTESEWLDAGNDRCGGTGGPDGVTNVYDYLDWLRENDIARYSAFSARVSLGAQILPWQHWHHPAPVSPVFGRGEELPWCCGMPAHLVRDGWNCRESGRRLSDTAAGGRCAS